MQIGQLKITRIGIYWFARKYQLVLLWCCRWHWVPEISPGLNGGGWIVWGKWMLEKEVFDDDDDWGEQLHDRRRMIIDCLRIAPCARAEKERN